MPDPLMRKGSILLQNHPFPYEPHATIGDNSTMDILLIGAQGQLGLALQPLLAGLGTIHAVGHSELDLAHAPAVRHCVQQLRPQLIINAAAYTAVDRAESEPYLAQAINGIAPGVLAEEAGRLSGALIHFSTDYVFDGTQNRPYVETDAPHPLGAYGESKWLGERAVQATGTPALILRTSWVYSLQGNNFLKTMLRLGQERDQVRVVNDQWGAPTWTHSLAQATVTIIRHGIEQGDCVQYLQQHQGLYHLTNAGATTWYEFARTVFALRPECTAKLTAIPTSEYPTPARRPSNGRLDNRKIAQQLGIALPDWKDALQECLHELP
jgi:dTDP-4-dehydrorhamnose reductase